MPGKCAIPRPYPRYSQGMAHFPGCFFRPDQGISLVLQLTFFSSQTDRVADKQTDRPRDRQMDRQTERQTDTHTDKQTDTHTNIQTNRQTNKQTYRQTNRQTNRQTSKKRANSPRATRGRKRLVKRWFEPLDLFFTSGKSESVFNFHRFMTGKCCA